MEQIDYKGHVIKIVPDEDPENPRTAWDNVTEMICFHKRYQLGDKHEYNHEHYNGWEELREAIEEDAAVILPLYLFDHSGLTIRTGEYSCQLDSGQVGFIRMTKEQAKQYPDYTEERLYEILVSDVKTYDMFLRSEVVGYEVCDGTDEVIESCYGYYSEDDAIADAKGSVDYTWVEKHALFVQAGIEVDPTPVEAAEEQQSRTPRLARRLLGRMRSPSMPNKPQGEQV